MSLDTQTFGISRYWLSVALKHIPDSPDMFSSAKLGFARKAFLAGNNQLKAIRSWLSNSSVLKTTGREVTLTPIGEQMRLRDELAQRAWSWWMFHLHLCANKDAFPYSTFFNHFDADGSGWLTPEEVVDTLTKSAVDSGNSVERTTVSTYFEGIDRSLRPGSQLYSLGLIERRQDGDGVSRLKRRLAKPSSFVVCFATILFHRTYFPTQPTIEMRMLLQKGLGRALGLRDNDMREALAQAVQEPGLAKFVQYRRAVNLDSVQVAQLNESKQTALAALGYSFGDIRWA